MIDAAEIRRRYEQLTAKPEESELDLLADDVVISQTPTMPGTAGSFHGHEGARANLAEIAEGLVDIIWQPERIEQLDDGRWLILLNVSGRGTSSGVPTGRSWSTSPGTTSRID